MNTAFGQYGSYGRNYGWTNPLTAAYEWATSPTQAAQEPTRYCPPDEPCFSPTGTRAPVAAPSGEYTLAHVIRDPKTQEFAPLPLKPKSIVETPGASVAAGTPHTAGSWFKENWAYVAAGTVLLTAGIGLAVWNPKGKVTGGSAESGQRTNRGGLRTNRRRRNGTDTGLTWTGLILRLAGMAAGLILVVIPTPVTTLIGAGLVVTMAGSTMNAISAGGDK